MESHGHMYSHIVTSIVLVVCTAIKYIITMAINNNL